MTHEQRESLNKLTLEWLKILFSNLKDGQRDWVGVYWKESFLFPEKSESTDLIVGPYIGPVTPHVRIPEAEGLCGLAVREGRTVNVADVNADPRFLACSTTTKSEIVIPIRKPHPEGAREVTGKMSGELTGKITGEITGEITKEFAGEIIGELDIDSNYYSTFDSKLQSYLEDQVVRFAKELFSKNYSQRTKESR